MALSLSKLSKNSNRNYDLKLLAGKGGLETVVRWVHIVEDMEVPDFLHGNELVFTTGIAHHQPNWLLYFVKNLKNNNVAGLVVNLGPYIESIPPQVIVFCEQNDFPLFTIPWETRIVDITYDFCRFIINDEKQEQSLTEAFKNLILYPENAKGYETTLQRTGFSQSADTNVILIEFTQLNDNVTSRFISENSVKFAKILRFNSSTRSMFVWNKSLVLIYQNITQDEISRLVSNITMLCEEKVNVNIGISDSLRTYSAVQNMYNQAQSAIKVAKISNKVSLAYKDLGIYKILLDIKNQDLLRDFYNDKLSLIEQFDELNNSDLFQTFKQYCLCSGRINEMAENAGVHRNTINYKMKKIKEILGCELTYEQITSYILAFTISNIIN